MNELPPETTNEKIKLSVKLADDKYLLAHLLVRVNSVPIFGTTGISLKNEKTKSLKKEIEVTLSAGKNRVEISVMNEKGTESLTEQVEIKNLVKHDKPTLYLVAYCASKLEVKISEQITNAVKTINARKTE